MFMEQGLRVKGRGGELMVVVVELVVVVGGGDG